LTDGLPSLKELVERELKRRAEGTDYRPAFWFVSHDKPGALTDVAVAMAAIIERADSDEDGDVVYVSPSIERAVLDKLHAEHPKRMAICNQVVHPDDSMRERGRLLDKPELVPGWVTKRRYGPLITDMAWSRCGRTPNAPCLLGRQRTEVCEQHETRQ
jgi:hypothetical protein